MRLSTKTPRRHRNDPNAGNEPEFGRVTQNTTLTQRRMNEAHAPAREHRTEP